jgi:hypothetical protein
MSYKLVRVVVCDNPECHNRDAVPYALSGEDDLPLVEGWREFHCQNVMGVGKPVHQLHACPSCPGWAPENQKTD